MKRMHPHRRRILLRIILGLLVLGCVIGLVAYALKQNISLFFTPSQIAAGHARNYLRIRVGGMVVQGSLQKNADLDVHFTMSDMHTGLRVHYRGVLPDLFREGQGVVAFGSMQPDGSFLATEVLAKHDERYMPPEIRDMRKQAV